MIEAVNSVLASAPLVRQNTDAQGGGALSNAAEQQSVRTIAQPPYVSTFISVDVNFDTAVILLRDADTGDTVRQIPTEGALEARRREQALEASSQESPINNVSEQSDNIVADVSTTSSNSEQTSAPQESAAPQSTPIAQNALSAFSSGAQAATTGETSSFSTSA